MAKTNIKMRKVLLAVLLAGILLIASCFSLAGCSGKSSTPTGDDTLRVGVRGDVVGFGYYNNITKKYYGLEIDIAQELANRLGYKNVEYTTVLPDDRKEILKGGSVDCLVACYSISDSRLKNFDFSPAYYEDSMVLMVEKSSMIENVDALKGKTVGTLSGSNAAPQLVEQLTKEGKTNGKALSANTDNTNVTYDNFHLLQLSSYTELSEALEAGKIDAVYLDGAIAKTFMQDNRLLISYNSQAQCYGVATQKDSDLSQPVAQTIQNMIDDGTIASLIDKWD